jgi:hypothetical protein
VSALAAMLKPLHQMIAQLDQQIQNHMDQHPDAALFCSLPGAGPCLAPRLLVAFGTNRERFHSATEVAQFYGIAPVVRQSGDTRTVHMRTRCPTFGRQSFHENAGCALRQEDWASCFHSRYKKNTTTGTTRPTAPWPSNSSASTTPVGKIVSLMTRNVTSELWKKTAARSMRRSKPKIKKCE